MKMAAKVSRRYNGSSAWVVVSLNFSSIKSTGTQVMKLLLLAAFVLPSLLPTGFMAQRNSDTLALEIALCPSGFSQLAIQALSRPVLASQSHHAHHVHFSHHASADPLVAPSDLASSHASHGAGESAELCPLAGPGSIIADAAITYEPAFFKSLLVYSEQTLAARAAALLPPPGRGPPTLS